MKLKNMYGEAVILTWSDHVPGCPSCRMVDIEKSATFANACVLGSQLLLEKLAQMQAPIESEKRKAVEKWAEDAGTFIKHRAKETKTVYKE